MVLNRQWVVARHPEEGLSHKHFDYREVPLIDPATGEVLIETLYLSLAPVMRMYMQGHSAAGERPLGIGDVIHGRGVGRVIKSNDGRFEVGDIVHGQMGWQTHKTTAATEQERFFRYCAPDLPPYLALGALGMTGFSAWCGFVSVGAPRVGDAVLVSGAAGGVGHIVVQIARLRGCGPIVGLAGGEEKCQLIRDLGCDAAIDYKSESVADLVPRYLPEGVDVYFDNVGGETLEIALDNLARDARVVLCGSISEYLRPEPFGPRNYTNLRNANASMRGFFVYNHAHEYAQAEQEMAAWIRAGKMTPRQDIIDGFESMPQALIDLYGGVNRGKQLVRVES